MAMDLDFSTLDPHDESADNVATLRGWANSVSRGFHDSRLTDEAFGFWLQAARADDVVMRGAWLPQGEFGAGPMPVATFTGFDGDLNTGAGLLPLHFITDVTVSPTHRRQGLLRRLMTADLQHAVDQGRPLAALTVSEGSIYGRFGFGVATWQAHLEVDVSAGFSIPGADRYGRHELVEPADLWPVPRDLFGRWHRETRGSLSRPAYYETMLKGEWDWEKGTLDAKLRGAVHLDESGEPDGYVLYRHDGWKRPFTATVVDMVGTTPRAYLAMWQFLADMDLCDVVKVATPVEDVLVHALQDPMRVRYSKVQNHIWLRVLDVVAALEARPWYGDGRVVLEISDSLGHAEGRWRVDVRDRVCSVTRTEEPGTVGLDVSVLSALYLGGVRSDTMLDAGRIHGDTETLATWSRMLDGGPAPISKTSF